MALLKENINNLIVDDLDKRNQNWTAIDDSLELKADKSTTYTKTEVDTSLGLKANKQQEAWKTATLVNGFTGTLRYRKTQFNQLEIHCIALSGGTIGSKVCDFPAGYMPAFSTVFFTPTSFNDAFAKFSLTGKGTLTLFANGGGNPTITNISLPLD